MVLGSAHVSSSLASLHLFPALACGVSILGGVVWLSRCLALRVFLHVSPALASGVRLSRCLFFSFSDSFVSQFICLQLSVCFTAVVSDFFLVFTICLNSICLPIHMFPLVTLVVVSWSFFIIISFVIGPFFLLSQELHQHEPQIAII